MKLIRNWQEANIVLLIHQFQITYIPTWISSYYILNLAYLVLAFSSEVQSHVMEGHEEMEHMICHGSTEVQDVMCQQQSGDPEHMTELEVLLANWLGEGSAEAQGSAWRSAVWPLTADYQPLTANFYILSNRILVFVLHYFYI